MNIFEALCEGKGCINEENTSSFLGYLLNPIEDHGMKDVFIKLFLEKIINLHAEEMNISDYDIQLEFPVDSRKRIIDIVFKTQQHIIAIENKIKIESCEETQLFEEYCGLKNFIEDDVELNSKNIIICMLAPANCEFEKYQKNIPDGNFKKITWDEVIALLREIIDLESQAKINPIEEYVKQTIKAFINFINNIQNIKSAQKFFDLKNGEKYRITSYSSGTITIDHVLSNSEYENVTARKIIRAKLEEIDPINYSYEITSSNNTRYWGAKLFEVLP